MYLGFRRASSLRTARVCESTDNADLGTNSLNSVYYQEVGFVDLWGSFVGRAYMYIKDGLHLSGKRAAVFADGLSAAADTLHILHHLLISDWFQMAEVLNEYFSSVFTTENISSFPVQFTKFEGNTSEHLGQLFVTPEMIAKKIKKMKDNKSPGVDGIPPKLLKEIIEQISAPLALFNLSLEEGIVPSEWRQTLHSYLRRDLGISQKIADLLV